MLATTTPITYLLYAAGIAGGLVAASQVVKWIGEMTRGYMGKGKAESAEVVKLEKSKAESTDVTQLRSDLTKLIGVVETMNRAMTSNGKNTQGVGDIAARVEDKMDDLRTDIFSAVRVVDERIVNHLTWHLGDDGPPRGESQRGESHG